MSIFLTKISKIKKNGPTDIIKIDFGGKKISLKVVDDSDETISLLTEWRKKSRRMFATNFRMSNSRTKKWIQQNILKNPNCILFIIYVDDRKVGNLALDLYDEKFNSIELDNYMKDPNYNFPGLMTILDKVFLKWVFEELKISRITTKIFSDNYKMLNVHIQCGGWSITNIIPLKMIKTTDGWIWKKTKLQSNKFAERYMNELEVKYDKLMKSFGKIDYDFVKVE